VARATAPIAAIDTPQPVARAQIAVLERPRLSARLIARRATTLQVHMFADVIGWSDFRAAPGGPLVHAVNPDEVELAMCAYPLDHTAASTDLGSDATPTRAGRAPGQ
jgi:hypothetical protein